jgi:hypothetical protein
MRPWSRHSLRDWILAPALLLLLAACGGGGSDDPSANPPPPPGQLVADFLLPDVNPASVTTGTDVSCLGVNGIGHESGNAAICAGRVLPWLQDQAAVNAWVQWVVNYRDVFVLDDQNRVITVYNLTDNNLAVPEKYAELKSILLAASAP